MPRMFAGDPIRVLCFIASVFAKVVFIWGSADIAALIFDPVKSFGSRNGCDVPLRRLRKGWPYLVDYLCDN